MSAHALYEELEALAAEADLIHRAAQQLNKERRYAEAKLEYAKYRQAEAAILQRALDHKQTQQTYGLHICSLIMIYVRFSSCS